MRFSLLFALAFVAAPALASVGTQSSENGMIKKRLVGGASKYTGSSDNPTGELINLDLLNDGKINVGSVVDNRKRDEEVEKRSGPIINGKAGDKLKANILSIVNKRSSPEPEKRSPGQGEIINIEAANQPDINILSKKNKRSNIEI